MISKNKRSILVATVLAGAAFAAAPASAQATRTWISGVGDDANPCSRTAPCKTFAGAISKTAAGGEINCIDSGGFGAVTITKSISLRCDEVEAGVLIVGTNAININAGDTDYVTISGLDLYGVSPSNPGLSGVNVINAGNVQIRNTTIHGFATQGISVNAPAGKTQTVYLENVILDSNGSATTGTGAMKVAVQGAGATANIVVNNTRFLGNQNAGIRVDSSGSTGGTINLAVSNSTIANSGLGVQLKAPTGTAAINAVISDTVITNNGNYGVFGNGAGVKALVTRSSIMMNANGVSAINSAVINSSVDNNLTSNTIDGAFSGTTPHN